jgi:hypothetical protein
MTDLAGFWSYAHLDDKNSGGRVLGLSQRISEAFQLLSGEELKLFTDRKIEWGEEWESRIQEELERTTFLIPIITPSYFRQDYCRKELLQFASAAKRFGVEQLLLPVYYVDVPAIEVDEAPSDEAVAIIKATQWADARAVRLENESSAAHRKFVDELAQRLVAIAAETEVQPARPRSQTPLRTTAEAGIVDIQSEGPDEADGSLDVLARGEEVLPRWIETIQGITSTMGDVQTITNESTVEMKSKGGNSFAGRLAVANRFAQRLDPPAERLVSLGSDYVSQLFEVDPAVKALLQAAREEEDEAPSDEVQQFTEAIAELAGTSRESMEQVEVLAGTLHQNARFSRELKRPLRKMEGALRSMMDAQAILDRWLLEIEELEEKRESTSGENAE